jgi:hypothetical protein
MTLSRKPKYDHVAGRGSSGFLSERTLERSDESSGSGVFSVTAVVYRKAPGASEEATRPRLLSLRDTARAMSQDWRLWPRLRDRPVLRFVSLVVLFFGVTLAGDALTSEDVSGLSSAVAGLIFGALMTLTLAALDRRSERRRQI